MKTEKTHKICTKCNISKPNSTLFFYPNKKKWLKSECKTCSNMRSRITQKLNPKRHKEMVLRSQQKARNILDDNYLKHLIYNLDNSLTVNDITTEMVELKRKQIQLTRWIKENK